MNEQLQEALAELLGKANNGIDTAGDFLASELPEVIQQLLMWHGVKSFIVSLICILAPFIIYKVSAKIARLTWQADDADMWDYPHVIIPTGVIGGFALIMCTANINLTWLQIWIAPKVWLIEYAASLAK